MMEEKHLILSEEHETAKKIMIALTIISAVMSLILFASFGGFTYNFLEALAFTSPALAIMIICIIVCFYMQNCKLVVTDKRVYGTATFGKRVDLPLDSISAVGKSWLWGVDVGTSSGRIHFKLIKNQYEIHSALSKLLLERQYKKETAYTQTSSNADELKKFKDLLDSGAITQAEFDEKKKQLLGL